MGFVKSLFKGPPKVYKSNQTGNYETGTAQAIANRMGATKKEDGTYDYSKTGMPIEGAEGVRKSSEGYDFSPQNQAIAGYRKPTLFNQTYSAQKYDPYQFKFDGLADKFGDAAYQQGAKGIARAGQSRLEQIKEAAGTRRPGALVMAAGQNARDIGEQEAGLRGQIGLEQMRSNIQAQQAQQQAQAGENMNSANFNAGELFKGYGSRADLEKANEANRMANLQGLESAGQNKIQTQSGLVQNERNYKDQALQYLQQLFGTAMGGYNQGASTQTTQQGNALGFVGNILGAFKK